MKSKREIMVEVTRTFEKIISLKSESFQEKDYNKNKALMTEMYKLEAYLEALTWVVGGKIDGEIKRR